MKGFVLTLIVLCSVLASGCPVMAGPLSGAVKTGAKILTGKAASAATKQAVQQAGKQATSALARKTAEAAARQTAIRLTRLLGDDAARIVRSVAGKAVTLADDVVMATTKVSARNGRRLEMLVPVLKKQGKLAEVTTLVNKSPKPGELLEMLWKHREKIAAGAAITALVVHGDDIAKAAAEHVARPVIESSMQHVVAPVVARTSIWGMGLFLLAIPVSLSIALAVWCRSSQFDRCVKWFELAWRRITS
ncbi:hypothetical protein DTL42_07055 [Bremerella cremea]|uniref:Uncharacterized protein n=1 Tax=Bremerella cremea TaxID=1031537 RepID=A0A368KZE4_9BACT|nr:hypothetical protein [Bremerella cremea]RCS54862.1 hypothetical protein DTL42_07055 [Bremerella cremea]